MSEGLADQGGRSGIPPRDVLEETVAVKEVEQDVGVTGVTRDVSPLLPSLMLLEELVEEVFQGVIRDQVVA